MPHSPRTGRLTALAVSPLLLLGLSGCSGDSGLSREEQTKRWDRVVEDPTPAVQDVIDAAGAPEEALRSGDGALLLRFFVTGRDDDEGPAAYAWRLYSPDGKKVAEHAAQGDMEMGLPGSYVSCPGGFLHLDGKKPEFLDSSGRTRPVTEAKEKRPPRPGDVQVSDILGTSEPVYAFRPSDLSMAPVPKVSHNVVGLAIDSRDGTAWEEVDDQETESPSSITASNGTRSIQLPKGHWTVDTAAGGGTLAALTNSGYGKHTTPALRAHRTETGWREIPDSAELPLKSLGREAEVQVLSDGRILLLSTYRKTLLLGDRTGAHFAPIKTPVRFVRFSAQGTTLVGIADSNSSDVVPHVEGEGVWTSTDGGRHWKHFLDGDL